MSSRGRVYSITGAGCKTTAGAICFDLGLGGGSFGRAISLTISSLPFGQGSFCQVTRPLPSVQRWTVTVSSAGAAATAGSKNAKLRANHVFMPGIVRLPGGRRQLGSPMVRILFIFALAWVSISEAAVRPAPPRAEGEGPYPQ